MQVILLLGQNYHYDLGPDVSMVVALSLDTAGSSPRYIPAILPDNVQVSRYQDIRHPGHWFPFQFVADQLVKIEAATLSNHTVLIIAETAQLGVYK